MWKSIDEDTLPLPPYDALDLISPLNPKEHLSIDIFSMLEYFHLNEIEQGFDGSEFEEVPYSFTPAKHSFTPLSSRKEDVKDHVKQSFRITVPFQFYMSIIDELYDQILKSRLEPEATEKFPNNMEISEWRPRFDGIFGISSLEEEGDM
ncbi:hypothetical protein LXL04_039083 [Taraxacum kok-saghyz]